MVVSARAVATAIGVLLLVGACQPASGSVAPVIATSSVGVPATAPEPAASAAAAPSSQIQPGQTDTAWGRIWDSLPPGFPSYPGATPAEEAATGPASAILAVQGAEARAVTDWMQSKLELASYSTEARSGPLEDGSFVLDSSGRTPGCRVQVSIAPLGELITATILYGASCPRP